MEEGLSCGWWREDFLMGGGGRVVLWIAEEGMSFGWWRMGCLMSGCGRGILSMVVL